MRSTKKSKSSTVKNWNIKGIENETRQAVTKAAKKKGMTIGSYVNEVLRLAAIKDLKSKTDPPIKVEDIQTQLAQMNDTILLLSKKLDKPKKSIWSLFFTEDDD